ncbi:transporter [Rhodovulum sp. BSW8]|uniref:Molybdopterin-binding protein n=1 Tax=Rhodovulum visakhapatnamense TaxID=364297 RepID=A0A4R8FPA6_9RHOB|nr:MULTISPECIES: TOBE domain-containing protein [Rhodovulum]OLS45230.1 transporter [Rhodovulum sulfidophilum]MBL3569785.1 TOBE domain-containing protein [Rhodovulum visakhapatnamense]MBL3580088.1 TOBE domain-containing protein [Rhodovulum visakhapatnamense]RBO53437.1 transporter [Rhodovulum sp. BSW8]TDX28260.1 molybdopterin-binding protein [Rhodovulum visakhapatnamense]
MKLSARNILTGTVTAVETGTVTTHVKIDVGGGAIVTASITNEAATDLDLRVGDKASAIIKSTDVLVGKD